ncbi:MAG: hypothetical protein LAP39_21160 [Acidobacteriia bacterium]|nr:hypothetical protein [Terriglobia bacterium]
MSNREALIQLYAATPVAGILASPAYQKLYADHGKDSDFSGERHAVETAKVWVENENFLTPGLTQHQQLQKALELLVCTRRMQNQDLCYALIVAGYKPSWTAARQDYFDYAWGRIQAQFDFFFSFTTRNPAEPGENPINRMYRWFISHVLGPDEFLKADRKTKNLLADAIRQRVLERLPRMEGFYFPDSQYDNSDTLAKLEKALASNLVFVQLVQDIMFVAPKQGENFCFNEYTRAVALLQNDPHKDQRVVFVVADKDRKTFEKRLGLVPPPYLAWKQHVCRDDTPYLADVEFPNDTDARVKELMGLIDDKVSPRISAALDRLVTEAP